MEQKQKKLYRRMYERSKKALKKAIFGTTVALGIGAAVIACGGRPGVCDNGSPYCYPGKPDTGIIIQLDGGMSQQDAGRNDAVQFDAVAPQKDGGADGSQPPQYSCTISNPIGDKFNRDLGDRDIGAKDYPLNVPVTDPNANPFSDGAGGSIGPSQTNLNRVDGTMFAPFATSTVTDSDVGRTYVEQQDFWMSGDSHYSDVDDTVVGYVDFVAYTLRIKGENNDFGIPACSTPTNSTFYASCKDPDGAVGNATELHKVEVKFLGDDWLIAEMVPPTTTLSDETRLVSGGSATFVKESVGGVVNVYNDPLYPNPGLSVDNLLFRVDNVDGQAGKSWADISVLDSNGNELERFRIDEGTTKSITVNGKTYFLRAWKVSPGIQPGARWVQLSILSDIMKLQSGLSLDPDNAKNKYWHVDLGWQNRGGSINDTLPDHLRVIAIYSDNIPHLSNGGSYDLKPGDKIPIAQDPESISLTYKGLSDTPSTYSLLQFDLERNSPYAISAAYGPNGQACIINAPYLRGISSLNGAVFQVSGASDNTFLVAANGGNCNGTAFEPGAVFMHQSPGSEKFTLQTMSWDGSNDVKFPTIADQAGISGGYIRVMKPTPDWSAMDPFSKVLVAIIESTGEIGYSVSPAIFAIRANGASSTLNFDLVDSYGNQVLKKDYLLYDFVGPVTTGYALVEEGFFTERGSKFVSITDTTLTFDIAGELVYSQFVLAKK